MKFARNYNTPEETWNDLADLSIMESEILFQTETGNQDAI